MRNGSEYEKTRKKVNKNKVFVIILKHEKRKAIQNVMIYNLYLGLLAQNGPGSWWDNLRFCFNEESLPMDERIANVFLYFSGFFIELPTWNSLSTSSSLLSVRYHSSLDVLSILKQEMNTLQISIPEHISLRIIHSIMPQLIQKK